MSIVIREFQKILRLFRNLVNFTSMDKTFNVLNVSLEVAKTQFVIKLIPSSGFPHSFFKLSFTHLNSYVNLKGLRVMLIDLIIKIGIFSGNQKGTLLFGPP